jgi:energy-coupling factor transport system permease protein
MRNGVFAAADPRARAIFCMMMAFQALFADSPLWLAACAALLLIVTIPAGVSPVVLLGRTVKVAWILIFIWLANLYNAPGRVWFAVGDFAITHDGVARGLLGSARLLVIYWSAVLLSIIVTPDEVMRSIEQTTARFQPMIGPATMVLSISMHLAPSMVRLAGNIRDSMIARGIAVDTGGLRRVRGILSAALPLFAASVRMSGHLALSMEARCYDPGRRRTSFMRYKLRPADWLIMGVPLLPLLVPVAGF